MKPSYRILDVTDFTQIGLTRSSEPGAPPRQMMVPIEKLVVDPEYQRDVGRSGRTNIRKIVDEFRWSRFEPIVVAETGDGRFAIINGQHRAMAAKLRGMKTVPCAVVDADRAEQAAAFAAINGNITAITSIQLFHASLAAGNVESKALATVCKAAGVRICRYPVPAREMKVGDTLAAGALLQCYRQYGPQVLQLSLECVTRTGGGQSRPDPLPDREGAERCDPWKPNSFTQARSDDRSGRRIRRQRSVGRGASPFDFRKALGARSALASLYAHPQSENRQGGMKSLQNQ